MRQASSRGCSVLAEQSTHLHFVDMAEPSSKKAARSTTKEMVPGGLDNEGQNHEASYDDQAFAQLYRTLLLDHRRTNRFDTSARTGGPRFL